MFFKKKVVQYKPKSVEAVDPFENDDWTPDQIIVTEIEFAEWVKHKVEHDRALTQGVS